MPQFKVLELQRTYRTGDQGQWPVGVWRTMLWDIELRGHFQRLPVVLKFCICAE